MAIVASEYLTAVDYRDPNASKLFAKSLHETGFGILKNHPIPVSKFQKMYDAWGRFFLSPENEKMNYLFSREVQDGYFPPNIAEKAKGYDVIDIKEFYGYYPYGRCPDHLRGITQEMHELMVSLGTELLGWIDTHTPAEIKKSFSEPLPSMMKNSIKNLLRLIHYPPLKGTEHQSALRAAPHEDINLITLLPAATTMGLQVKDRQGQWHDVVCDSSCLIINIGDMLQEASQGYYPSTTHQVINPKNAENISRFSMPLFLHPRNDVVLSERYTAIAYLNERLEELGIK